MFTKNKVSTSALICYFIIVVLFAVLRMISAFGVFENAGDYVDILLNIVIQILILFCISIFIFSFLTKNKIKDTFKFYGYKKISLKAILISVSIGIIVYFLNIFVATFFNVLLALFGYNSVSSSTTISSYPFWLFLINIFITAVLPGICEETAHRGMLLKGLSGHGQTRALIISSLLFGFMHMNIEQFFYATLIGLLVGYIAIICDSIYPAIIVHFMNNAISVFAGYSSFNNLGFEKIIGAFNTVIQTNFILGFLIIIMFIIGLAMLLKILLKLLFKETTVKNMESLQEKIMNQIKKENYLKELDAVKNDREIESKNFISFEEFDKLYKQNNQEMGLMSKLEKDMLAEPNQKYNLLHKILFAGIFIISAGVTIFTFIWGVI